MAQKRHLEGETSSSDEQEEGEQEEGAGEEEEDEKDDFDEGRDGEESSLGSVSADNIEDDPNYRNLYHRSMEKQ